MSINKALVKHETKNMKWMMLYFFIISLSGVLYFNADLNGQYIESINRGLSLDTSLILSSVISIVQMITIPIGIGILLMIFLQFKDSKSVEVGNFLKSLPISNREFYITKLMGGLVSLTLPTIVLILGILLVRSNNMFWIKDIHASSLITEIVAKGDSVINIVSIFIMTYMVAVSTYTFLFMIQYIIMDIIAALVIGSLVWLSPSFILTSIAVLYNGIFEKITFVMKYRYSGSNLIRSYIQPWLYPLDIAHGGKGYGSIENLSEIVNKIDIKYYDGLVWKVLIALTIAAISIALGYILSKKSKVEDNDTFISFKWARKVFIAGVTVCSSLLMGVTIQMFLGAYNPIGFITLHTFMIVAGAVGFIVSKKLSENKSKQGGII